MRKIKISLLSTSNAPQLGYILREMEKNHIEIHSILFDSKILTPEQVKFWEERTKGKLPFIPLDDFNHLNISTYNFKNHSSMEVVNFVKEHKIDILVNAGTPRILKKSIIHAPQIGILNCHPGLLPDFRGCTCVEWSIYYDKEVGNTVHLMTEKIDEGPIILREALTLTPKDTYNDIRIKVYLHNYKLLAKGLKKIALEDIDYFAETFPIDGDYYEAIDQEKMSIVIKKINNGKYLHLK